MSHLVVYWNLVRLNPDFRRLCLARLVSFAGDWFLVVPIAFGSIWTAVTRWYWVDLDAPVAM